MTRSSNVEKVLESWRYVAGGIGAFIIAALGGWSVPLEVLLIVMGIDVFSGMVRSAAQHQWSSNISGKGMAKKAMFLLLVMMVYQMSRVTETPAARDAVIWAFIISEGLSVVENASALGIIIPDFITNLLKQANPKKFERKDNGS